MFGAVTRATKQLCKSLRKKKATKFPHSREIAVTLCSSARRTETSLRAESPFSPAFFIVRGICGNLRLNARVFNMRIILHLTDKVVKHNTSFYFILLRFFTSFYCVDN